MISDLFNKNYALKKADEQVKSASNLVPRDENGNPMYTYIKVEKSIDGKYNYRYSITGDPLFMPDEIEGKPVPVGSMFISWNTLNVWVMRNTGWAEADEDEPEATELITPVLSIVGEENKNFTITATGETVTRIVGSTKCKIPVYSAVNDDTIYEYEAEKEMTVTLVDGADADKIAIYKDDELVTSPFIANLEDEFELFLKEKSVDKTYGAIINVAPVITPNPTYYDDLEDVGDHIYKADYSELDYDFAKQYYSENAVLKGFACSAIVKDGKFAKNNDWLYDNNAELVIKTSADAVTGRKATLGVCSAVEGLTDEVCSQRLYSQAFRLAPFCMVDGINEDGLTISVNTVPNEDKGDNDTIGTGAYELPIRMLSRYLLDNCASVDAAIAKLSDLTITQTPGRAYDLHFLIADSTKCVYLEFVNGAAVSAEINYITNFHVSGTTLNDDNTVYTPETKDADHSAMTTNGITPHGEGLERWNLIVNNYSESTLAELLEMLHYSREYSTHADPSNPYWFTEFVDGEVNVDSDADDFSAIVEIAGQAYTNRSRDNANTWHTTHSSIYDIANTTLNVKPQEGADGYDFSLSSAKKEAK